MNRIIRTLQLLAAIASMVGSVIGIWKKRSSVNNLGKTHTYKKHRTSKNLWVPKDLD